MSFAINETENEHPKAHRFKVDKIKYKSDLSIDEKIPEPFPKGAGCVLVIGKVASGKTSLVLSLLCKRVFFAKKYNKLFIFSPSLIGSGNLDDEHPINTEIPDEQKFSDLNNEDLSNCIDSIYGTNKKVCWLFDDCQNSMVGQTLKTLRDLVQNRRHYSLKGNCLFITSQCWNQIDTKIRKNSDCCLFYTTNRMEIESIRRELVDYLTIEQFDEILDYVFETPHAFLYIKNGVPPEKQFYKNFNPLSITVEKKSKGKTSKFEINETEK